MENRINEHYAGGSKFTKKGIPWVIVKMIELKAPGPQRMSYYVYILWSEKIQKYYVGSTQDVENRINEHNAGGSKFTRKGIPWVIVKMIELKSRLEAIRLEIQIKKRGIKRFLDEFGR